MGLPHGHVPRGGSLLPPHSRSRTLQFFRRLRCIGLTKDGHDCLNEIQNHLENRADSIGINPLFVSGHSERHLGVPILRSQLPHKHSTADTKHPRSPAGHLQRIASVLSSTHLTLPQRLRGLVASEPQGLRGLVAKHLLT